MYPVVNYKAAILEVGRIHLLVTIPLPPKLWATRGIVSDLPAEVQNIGWPKIAKVIGGLQRPP